ncbi:MAG: cadherin repeat domain-containing protein [Kiritimatiellae bacterium]|nr:cadherin repeat domain-containing protein [Kiritimatiellia bacterium]
MHFAATSFEGDAPLTFSATATNLTSGVTITDQSYFHFDHNYSMMHPDYYDFTFHTPEGFEPCEMRFTITATGRGGSASQSFDCTFTEGVVPTPPQIYSPWLNPPFVLAGRTISGRVGCEEADGDVVTFSFVSGTSQQGTFTIDPSSGDFSFTPTRQDVGDSPEVHVFTVRATDKDDSSDANITIVVLPVSQPQLTHIKPQTVLCGDTLQVALVVEDTEYDSYDPEYIDDPLISSNITIKAGTTTPEGEYVFEDGCLSFTPTTNDIGQTFIFTASATDLDGTTNQDFNVTVGLAAPVLKHCPVDQWTATSFTADIEEAVPGATSYNLRRIRHEDDGTPVTNTVSVASFPYVVSGLATTNYVYDVQAIRGAVTSQWSNAKSIDLHAYIAPTYAIPMKGAARGSHHETFDGLISSGSAYWYDARTIPGWYAASSSGSMSDVKYAANTGGSSGTGILSCQVDDEAVTNRALAARADTQYDEFSFGVMFTNMCKYAVTNLHVSFTAMQFRRYNPISHLYFSYTRSNRLIDYNDPENIWTPVGALDFAAPTQGSSDRLYPPTEAPKSADIPFEGVNAIQPGEVIALRWYLDAKSNWPTLGIDDLDVSWRCAWPSHTVIMLQ